MVVLTLDVCLKKFNGTHRCIDHWPVCTLENQEHSARCMNIERVIARRRAFSENISLNPDPTVLKAGFPNYANTEVVNLSHQRRGKLLSMP